MIHILYRFHGTVYFKIQFQSQKPIDKFYFLNIFEFTILTLNLSKKCSFEQRLKVYQVKGINGQQGDTDTLNRFSLGDKL